MLGHVPSVRMVKKALFDEAALSRNIIEGQEETQWISGGEFLGGKNQQNTTGAKVRVLLTY